MKSDAKTKDIRFAVRSIASPIEGDCAENEDNYLTIDGDGQMECLLQQRRTRALVAGWPAGHRRLAVLDGVGGHGHGREIAERVVAGLSALPACSDQLRLNAALDDLHRSVQAEFSGAAMAPGTTLLLIEMPPHGPALLYHVGDSRLFALRATGLELLTVDHSPPTAFALKGLISESEWRKQVLAEDRRAISQAFGLGSSLLEPGVLEPELTPLGAEMLPSFLAHLPDRRAIEIEPDAVYLLATDGLWSFQAPSVFLKNMSELIGHSECEDLADLVDQIVLAHYQASRQEPHVDNTTFIVFRATKGESICA